MRWVCRAWATGKTRALKTQTGSLAWLCKCWHRIQQLSGFKKDICELHTLRIHSNICYQRGIPVCESNFTHNLKEGQDLMWIEHGPWRYLLINPNYIPLNQALSYAVLLHSSVLCQNQLRGFLVLPWFLASLLAPWLARLSKQVLMHWNTIWTKVLVQISANAV